jgi:hypothetical protein
MGRGQRGRTRGGKYRGDSKRSTHGNTHSDKPDSQVNKPRRALRDKYRICYHKEYFAANCIVLRGVQQEELRKREQKEIVNKVVVTEESSNIALAEETDSDSYYSGPTVATVLMSSTSTSWALDSGVSKHFTGTHHFTGLK